LLHGLQARRLCVHEREPVDSRRRDVGLKRPAFGRTWSLRGRPRLETNELALFVFTPLNAGTKRPRQPVKPVAVRIGSLSLRS